MALIKPRLSRLQAGFWWTAIYHLEVKGQPDCPAYSTSGISLGRCLRDATTRLTGQQQVMDAEWGRHGWLFAASTWKQHGWLGTSTYSSFGQHCGLEAAKTLADVKVGMFPQWQAAACHQNRPVITISLPFPMTYPLSPTLLSSSQLLIKMQRDSCSTFPAYS